MADEPRMPHSLQGLFNFCLEATKSEDVESTSQFQAMTDEDKQFINEAIRAAMGSDPVKLMIEDLKLLSGEGETGAVAEGGAEEKEERMEEALENLQMHCENMDLANDFHKIGGYQVLPWLLQHPSPGLRWRTADLMATLTQNNEYSQKQVLDDGLLTLLLRRLDQDEDETVKVKLLYAVSCLSRDYLPAQEELLKLDGFSPLLRAMQVNNHKLQTKVAFLLATLSSTNTQIKETLCDMGYVEQLVSLLRPPHSPHHEHLLRALCELTDTCPKAVAECRRPELALQRTLRERFKLITGKEESQEELAHVTTLLGRLWGDDAGVSADR